MPHKKPHVARDQQIVELYKTTLAPLAEIGAKFGISHQRVHKILKREGVEPVRLQSRRMQHLTERAVVLAAEQRSAPEIAQELGVSLATVYRILQQQGVRIQHVAHARDLPAEKAAQLLSMYKQVPSYRGERRAVCTSAEGRALVEYIQQLRQEGYSADRMGQEVLGLSRARIYQWLRHYEYRDKP